MDALKNPAPLAGGNRVTSNNSSANEFGNKGTTVPRFVQRFLLENYPIIAVHFGLDAEVVNHG